MGRAEQLRKMTAQLVANVELYPTAYPGWGCPCMISKEDPLVGWDAWPLLGDSTLEPGDERQLGFVFLALEGLEHIRAAGKFYLWEGRFIGEATVVS
jgi:hypothetical protein